MISVVIPAYNEEKNIQPLYDALREVLEEPYEIVFVEDGSSDQTFQKLKELNNKDKNVRVVKFAKNYGQTAAMDAGFKNTSGDIVIAMDADLQNDPKDIPRLVAKLNEGYDCVSGWRANRKDKFSKKLFSRFANLLRKILINDNIHDSGCSLKAYKKECLKDLNLYSDMHRFIPALLRIRGCKIGEIKVNHKPRLYGETKYGFKRIFKGFSDLIKVRKLLKKSANFNQKAEYQIQEIL